MMTQRLLRLGWRVLGLWLALCLWGLSAQAAVPIRIGVLSTRDQAVTQQKWQPLARTLQTALIGRNVTVKACTRDELEALIERRQLDFVLTDPGHYLLLARRAGLGAPLATLIADENGAELPGYGGVIFARADAQVDELADLRGKKVAAVNSVSLGGYQSQWLELRQAGVEPVNDFELTLTGYPQERVVQAVLESKVDVGFVSAGLLEAMALEGQLDASKLKVIHPQRLAGLPVKVSTVLYPQWPFSASAHVEERLARQVAAALYLMHEDTPTTRAMGIRGFAVPADYSPVDELLRELRAPPYDVQPVFTWRDVWVRYSMWLMLAVLVLAWVLMLIVRLVLARRSLATEVAQRRASEHELALSKELLLKVIDNIPLRIFWKDRDLLYQGCNSAFARDAGCERVDQVLGKDDFAFVWRDLAEEFRHRDRTVLSSQQPSLRYESRQIVADGSMQWVDVSKVPLRDAKGDVFGVLGMYEDTTERRRVQDQLRLAASVFEFAREGIFITDPQSNIVEVNQAFSVITGYSRADVLGRNPRLWKSGRQDPDFYNQLYAELQRQGHWHGEIWNKRKNGELYASMLTITAVLDERQQLSHYVALFFDITATKLHQQQLEQVAHYDTLTGLPNRVMLADRMQLAMAQSQRRGQLLAVVYLDLDGFKQVNDTHGHDVGDRLLVWVADQMKRALREGDTLARLGGDEFVAVLTDLGDASDSTSTVRRLLDAASLPLRIGDVQLTVSASLGVTFFPQADAVDADQLLRQADQAMYQAKLLGKNRFHLFDAAHDRSVRGLHEGLDEIARGLHHDEFVLHYQPKVHLRRGTVVGAEALIRWQHPTKGMLYPVDFLAQIDNQPLSVLLDEWVIEHALQQLQTWQRQGLDLPISVNVGARLLQQPDVVERLAALLGRYPDVSASLLQIEVLETSALIDTERAALVMHECDRLGVSFALDDFGTGYSSLTYLKNLPVATLKIDQSFVRDMLDDPDDLAILQAVIGLAQAFGREVIAEGMETVAQGVRLLQMGCEQAQGYGIARPMPAADLPGWVSRWQPDGAWLNVASEPTLEPD